MLLPKLFLINLFYLFIYFWLYWVFVAGRGLSLVVVSGGYSSLWCTGFSLWWLLLLRSTGSRRAGFSSCGSRAQQLWLAGSRAQAQQLWCTGLVAPRHVGSSRTRARTRVTCIGRQILNPCATREAPLPNFNDRKIKAQKALACLRLPHLLSVFFIYKVKKKKKTYNPPSNLEASTWPHE